MYFIFADEVFIKNWLFGSLTSKLGKFGIKFGFEFVWITYSNEKVDIRVSKTA